MILRYEDLLLNQTNSMQNLMKFLKKGSCPQGYQRYMNNIDNNTSIGLAGYKPKQGGIGKSFRLFTDEQVSTIERKCCHLLKQLGYRIITNDDTNTNIKKYSIELTALNVNDDIDILPIATDTDTIDNKVIINDNFCIRKEDDQFGRRMTSLRRGMTNDDKVPFPVKS
jgi:hypothetical protein